jgi:hypothetical protein
MMPFSSDATFALFAALAGRASIGLSLLNGAMLNGITTSGTQLSNDTSIDGNPIKLNEMQPLRATRHRGIGKPAEPQSTTLTENGDKLMRTLSIITALVALVAVSGEARALAGLNGTMLNGLSSNGIMMNGTTTDGMPANLNAFQVLEVILPNRHVASVRLPRDSSEHQSGQGSNRG